MTKNIYFLLFLASMILSVTSCNKDEDVIEERLTVVDGSISVEQTENNLKISCDATGNPDNVWFAIEKDRRSIRSRTIVISSFYNYYILSLD